MRWYSVVGARGYHIKQLVQWARVDLTKQLAELAEIYGSLQDLIPSALPGVQV